MLFPTECMVMQLRVSYRSASKQCYSKDLEAERDLDFVKSKGILSECSISCNVFQSGLSRFVAWSTRLDDTAIYMTLSTASIPYSCLVLFLLAVIDL